MRFLRFGHFIRRKHFARALKLAGLYKRNANAVFFHRPTQIHALQCQPFVFHRAEGIHYDCPRGARQIIVRKAGVFEIRIRNFSLLGEFLDRLSYFRSLRERYPRSRVCRTSLYQQGIHRWVRRRRPYFSAYIKSALWGSFKKLPADLKIACWGSLGNPVRQI